MSPQRRKVYRWMRRKKLQKSWELSDIDSTPALLKTTRYQQNSLTIRSLSRSSKRLLSMIKPNNEPRQRKSFRLWNFRGLYRTSLGDIKKGSIFVLISRVEFRWKLEIWQTTWFLPSQVAPSGLDTMKCAMKPPSSCEAAFKAPRHPLEPKHAHRIHYFNERL